MPLTAGTRLGHYEIISSLGAGGMGEVYSARDLHLGRKVAIKILAERLAESADALRRFEKEAKAVASLSHPNILDIHDFGRENGISYAVTELLEGETLRSRIARSPLPWRKALEIAIPVADGLAAAHSKGVIHRDLKPENIFITTESRVTILDFGLARLKPQIAEQELAGAATVSKLTEAGMILGTVPYMSPEQVRGDAADERSDIFALGCVLYEMLAGERAFGGKTSADTISAILKDTPQSLLQSGTNIPAELDHIVSRCLEKNPERRFQNSRDLAFALGETLGGSAPAGPGKALPTEAKSLLRTIGTVMLGITILAVLLVVWKVEKREQPPAVAETRKIGSLAVLPLKNLSGDPQQEYFADGMTEALIAELAQISSLRVISRTSVMQYKGPAVKPLPEIARELKVDGVLEGSVLRSGDRVRITAELIHAPTDRNLWAKSYDRDMKDIFVLQSEVARTIADEIKIQLTPDEKQRLTRKRTVDPEAYDLYLRGRNSWTRRTKEGIEQAIYFFEQALQRDPNFAQAYSGMADAYFMLGGYRYAAVGESMKRGREAATRALALDETIAEAHVSVAQIHAQNLEWGEAEKSYRRAIELKPNYATAHHWLGGMLADEGRLEEALSEMKRAAELDPMAPSLNGMLALIQVLRREPDSALVWANRANKLAPELFGPLTVLSRTYAALGQTNEALRSAQRAADLAPDSPVARASLARALLLVGRKQEAQTILTKLEAEQESCRTCIADIYFALGNVDRAVKYWEEEIQSTGFPMGGFYYPKSDPAYDAVRNHPLFVQLLRKMKLD